MWDIELPVYLVNPVWLVSLVVDLRIPDECGGSSSNPSLNGHLYYPPVIERIRNEVVTDKILQ